METRKDVRLARSTLVLCCYSIGRHSRIIACFARNNDNLDGHVPMMPMTGKFADIL